MNVHFVSLGCPKNRVDTEVMLGHTEEAGHQLVAAPETAEVIVVNTCGFIGEAKQESIDAILEMARHKQAGTCKRLVVAGCLSQRYPKELAAEMPEVDQFLGTDEVGAIAKAISGTIARLSVVDTPAYLYDDAAPRRRSQAPHSAYVKIAEGCDRPCAFCIIPKLRGPQRSRAPESVMREARDLASGGTREICLVAQDLTTYGTDLLFGDPGRVPEPPRDGLRSAEPSSVHAIERAREAPRLATLLRALAGIEELGWIRLHYAYPTACSDELLDVIGGEPRVAKYLDVPIQHVDSGVLKAMRRGYGERQVRDLVARFRQRVPNGTFRTTFIAGHPGETDAAFQSLCDFVREADLDHVGIFNFSREEGTVSGMLPKRVPQKEIDARRRELLRIQREVSKKKLRAMRDRTLRVLVEGASDESEYLLMGRHEGQAPEIDGQVYLSLSPDAVAPAAGMFVEARVTHSAEYDLAAEIIN
jgi:ribosomal protein S12 methylthiotransferase